MITRTPPIRVSRVGGMRGERVGPVGSVRERDRDGRGAIRPTLPASGGADSPRMLSSRGTRSGIRKREGGELAELPLEVTLATGAPNQRCAGRAHRGACSAAGVGATATARRARAVVAAFRRGARPGTRNACSTSSTSCAHLSGSSAPSRACAPSPAAQLVPVLAGRGRGGVLPRGSGGRMLAEAELSPYSAGARATALSDVEAGCAWPADSPANIWSRRRDASRSRSRAALAASDLPKTELPVNPVNGAGPSEGETKPACLRSARLLSPESAYATGARKDGEPSPAVSGVPAPSEMDT
eukprot:scaffold17793_cov131-Isochrysis_galbana.AAC.13